MFPSPQFLDQKQSFVTVEEDIIRKFTITISNLDDTEYIEELLKELQSSNITEKDYLVININCPGGSLEDTLHLMNSLTLMFGPNITTVISSHAYSAASLLFMIGSERIVFENSALMLHTFSAGMWGKSGEIFNDVTFTKSRFDDILDKMFGHYITKEDIEKIGHGADLYYDAEDMLSLGIATKCIKIDYSYSGEDDASDASEKGN
jgi:ATP-dependent protease ClpP protease subunit